VAAANGVGIYTSANSGSTWTLTSAPTVDWGIGCRVRQRECFGCGRRIWIPLTSLLIFGTNWMQTTTASSWECVAASANGHKLLAGDVSVISIPAFQFIASGDNSRYRRLFERRSIHSHRTAIYRQWPVDALELCSAPFPHIEK